MTTPPAFSSLQRLDWRKAGLGATSVVINLALLTAMSLTALGVRDRDQVAAPPVYLDIEPRPLLPNERPRQPVVADSNPLAQPTQPRQQTTIGSTAAAPDADRPGPPRPRPAPPAPEGVAAPDSAWRVDPDNRRAAMARSLRQGVIGCASPQLLNDAERRRCRDQFGERAAAAPPISGSGDPERDAAFARQGARRLAQWEAQRRPLSGGVGVAGPADCVGSNFGVGCAGAHLPPVPNTDMRQGADSLIRQGGNKVD